MMRRNSGATTFYHHSSGDHFDRTQLKLVDSAQTGNSARCRLRIPLLIRHPSSSRSYIFYPIRNRAERLCPTTRDRPWVQFSLITRESRGALLVHALSQLRVGLCCDDRFERHRQNRLMQDRTLVRQIISGIGRSCEAVCPQPG